MTTPSVSEFCDKVRFNKFGGAAEMVTSAVEAISESTQKCKANSVRELTELIEGDLDAILEVMPSIAPMTNMLHRLMCSIERINEGKYDLKTARDEIVKSVEKYLERQTNALKQIGYIGGQMIKDGDKIATYSTSGTVMSIFKSARDEGEDFEVVVTESRPANEGIRTMRETFHLGISVTFGIDAILGNLLPGSAMFIVGADVITSTGDVLAKVGTYLGALVAKEYRIPFYVAADTSKFDSMTLDGFPLKIRDKGPDVVVSEPVPEGVKVLNPSFELIPANLVTGIITELGLIHPGNVANIMRSSDLSQRLVDKLRKWLKAPTKS